MNWESLELNINNPYALFGILLLGFVLIRYALKKGKVKPKGGRYFKRKF
jgi:hypothetical protein